MMRENLPILIPVAFLTASLLIPLFGRRAPYGYAIALAASSFAAIVSFLGLLAAIEHGAIRHHLGGWPAPIGIELVMDPLSAFMALVVTGVATFALWHSARPVEYEDTAGKSAAFFSSAMLLLAGLSGIVLTGDLFNLYVFLEISAIAGYALVAVGDKRAPVASFRYLILGTVGASFYLAGVGLLYVKTGTLNMADMAMLLPDIGAARSVVVSLALIAVGLGLKMALFPLHGWLPDAYTYSTSTGTALLAPIGTKVAAYALIRIFFYVFEPDVVREGLPLAAAVGFLGAIGIVWGSILAIAQTDMKRMLAYSSVAQIGYVALGVGLASPLGLIGAVLHMLNHACMKACLFLISGNLIDRIGHARIPDLDHSLRRRMPWTSASFVVAAISMIGLPPTAGFFSKWYLVLGSWEQANWFYLAVILLSSLLNAVYFFRVIEKMYLTGGAGVTVDDDTPAVRDEPVASMLYPTVILAVALIVLGLINVMIVENVLRPMLPGTL